MDSFNDMIEELRLVDIQTINGTYTWNNRRGSKNQIASKLDRLLVSEAIMNKDVLWKPRSFHLWVLTTG